MNLHLRKLSKKKVRVVAMQRASKVSKLLLGINAVTLSPRKPYKFFSGVLSPVYCDNRLILSYHEKRNIIVNAFIEVIKAKKLKFEIIAGVATSGIPFATLLADRLKMPMVYVRSDVKKHGKQNVVEGRLEKGKKVLLVEDLISTGKSSIAAVQALRNNGAVVNDCIAIFTYNFKIAKDNFKANKCNLHVLSDFENLIEVAAKEGYIKKADLGMVLSWNKNPEVLGK